MNMEDIENKYVPQNFNQQFEEEKIKFDLMKESDWANAIMQYEDEKCLEGRILFLINYCSLEGERNLERFKEYATNAVSLLKAQDNRFERLLLNIKDSLYPCQLENMPLSNQMQKKFSINKIEQFSFFNKGKDNRDFGWHRLLNDNPDEYQDPRKNSLNSCQLACKNLLVKGDSFNEEIKPSDEIEEWKKLLVDCPSLIEYCNGSVLYIITYCDGYKQYYLSRGSKNALFNKKNKISELYLRYAYEKLHDEDSNWQFHEWHFQDSEEEKSKIECSITNLSNNITVKRIKNEWIVEGPAAGIDKDASIDKVIKALKEAGN